MKDRQPDHGQMFCRGFGVEGCLILIKKLQISLATEYKMRFSTNILISIEEQSLKSTGHHNVDTTLTEYNIRRTEHTS